MKVNSLKIMNDLNFDDLFIKNLYFHVKVLKETLNSLESYDDLCNFLNQLIFEILGFSKLFIKLFFIRIIQSKKIYQYIS